MYLPRGRVEPHPDMGCISSALYGKAGIPDKNPHSQRKNSICRGRRCVPLCWKIEEYTSAIPRWVNVQIAEGERFQYNRTTLSGSSGVLRRVSVGVATGHKASFGLAWG